MSERHMDVNLKIIEHYVSLINDESQFEKTMAVAENNGFVKKDEDGTYTPTGKKGSDDIAKAANAKLEEMKSASSNQEKVNKENENPEVSALFSEFSKLFKRGGKIQAELTEPGGELERIIEDFKKLGVFEEVSAVEELVPTEKFKELGEKIINKLAAAEVIREYTQTNNGEKEKAAYETRIKIENKKVKKIEKDTDRLRSELASIQAQFDEMGPVEQKLAREIYDLDDKNANYYGVKLYKRIKELEQELDKEEHNKKRSLILIGLDHLGIEGINHSLDKEDLRHLFNNENTSLAQFLSYVITEHPDLITEELVEALTRLMEKGDIDPGDLAEVKKRRIKPERELGEVTLDDLTEGRKGLNLEQSDVISFLKNELRIAINERDFLKESPLSVEEKYKLAVTKKHSLSTLLSLCNDRSLVSLVNSETAPGGKLMIDAIGEIGPTEKGSFYHDLCEQAFEIIEKEYQIEVKEKLELTAFEDDKVVKVAENKIKYIESEMNKISLKYSTRENGNIFQKLDKNGRDSNGMTLRAIHRIGFSLFNAETLKSFNQDYEKYLEYNNRLKEISNKLEFYKNEKLASLMPAAKFQAEMLHFTEQIDSLNLDIEYLANMAGQAEMLDMYDTFTSTSAESVLNFNEKLSSNEENKNEPVESSVSRKTTSLEHSSSEECLEAYEKFGGDRSRLETRLRLQLQNEFYKLLDARGIHDEQARNDIVAGVLMSRPGKSPFDLYVDCFAQQEGIALLLKQRSIEGIFSKDFIRNELHMIRRLETEGKSEAFIRVRELFDKITLQYKQAERKVKLLEVAKTMLVSGVEVSNETNLEDIINESHVFIKKSIEGAKGTFDTLVYEKDAVVANVKIGSYKAGEGYQSIKLSVEKRIADYAGGEWDQNVLDTQSTLSRLQGKRLVQSELLDSTKGKRSKSRKESFLGLLFNALGGVFSG